jgi:DNA-binding NarL/FixJ family response regulator
MAKPTPRRKQMANTASAPAASPESNGDARDLVLVDWAANIHPGRPGTAPRAIRVLIADGQALVRGGLRALFEAEADITVTAEAADGAETIALARKLHPDVVLVDIGLPGDGVEVTQQIVAGGELSGPSVMILAEHTDDERLFAALRAGASAFLFKETDGTELVQAVRVVAAGGAQLSPCITRRLVAEIASQPDPKRPSPEQLEDLTAREREVVALVAAGLNNQEIAERLVVSPATAKTHVSRALYKVDARDRAQLVALAYETGFVLPGHKGAPQSCAPVSPVALVAA